MNKDVGYSGINRILTRTYKGVNNADSNKLNGNYRIDFKLGKVTFLIVIFFICFLSGVEALAITPARATVDFTPDLSKTVSFTIVNSEKKDLSLVVAVQGELKDYIFIEKPNIEMKAEEQSKEIRYTVKLPHEMLPGPHSGEIVVLQLPEKGSLDVTYVGAALAVLNELVINVPYPGKYIESGLSIQGPDGEGNYNFLLPVISRGSFDILDARATIDIYCPVEGGVVATLNTNHLTLAPGERKDLTATWSPNVNSGDCKAISTLAYDQEKAQNFEKIFSVGGDALSLVTMEVPSGFQLGQIAEIKSIMRNNLREKSRNVKLTLEILGSDGNVLANPSSATQDIEPQEKGSFLLYWNTQGATTAKFPARLYVKYDGGERVISDLTADLREDSLTFVGTGYVIAKPAKAKGSGNSLFYVLIFLIAMLILINLSWFLFLRKRLSGGNVSTGK